MPLKTGSEGEARQGVVLASRGGPGTLPSGAQGGLIASGASSTVISNTAAETDFAGYYTFPAGGLNVPGGVLIFSATGTYYSSGTPTLILRVYIDTGIILDMSAAAVVTDASNQRWSILARVQLQPAIPGLTMAARPGVGAINLGTGSLIPNAAATASVTIVTPDAVKVTATWGTASNDNSINLDAFDVWLFGPQNLA